MASQSDRRRSGHPRIPFNVPATLEVPASADPAPLGLTENVSRGGLGLRFFEVVRPGMEVKVILHLFEQPAFMRVGRVAWVKRSTIPPGAWSTGITFHNELNAEIMAGLASEGMRSEG